MGWAKNRDCEICGEWVGQCCCEQGPCYDNSGEAIDRDMAAMQEECHQHFASIPPESDELPF